MSNILRIHKPPGTRIRLLRVDAPRMDAPLRAADHCAMPDGAPRSTGGDVTHGPGEAAPVDLNDPQSMSDPKDLSDMNARLHRALVQGRAEGRAEIREEMEKRLTIARTESDERIGALMEGIAQQVRAFTASLEHDAYAFALAVAERIVKREIQLDDEIVVRQVREALRRIVGVESIKVRVHPDDEALIRSHRAALLALTDTTRDVVIEADHTIERGGCILESASGNVDARIATQLRQVEHALRVEENVPGDHRS